MHGSGLPTTGRHRRAVVSFSLRLRCVRPLHSTGLLFGGVARTGLWARAWPKRCSASFGIVWGAFEVACLAVQCEKPSGAGAVVHITLD